MCLVKGPLEGQIFLKLKDWSCELGSRLSLYDDFIYVKVKDISALDILFSGRCFGCLK